MQYSALIALSSALMASGASAQLVPGYGLDPVQAAAMGPSMAAPWVASSSTPSRPTMVPMASSMKPHSKASMAPHMPTPIKPSMAPMVPFMHSAFASPSFHSIPLKPTPSPSSRFSKGVNRNQSANRPHKGSHNPPGGKHAIEEPSSEWHNADGMSQGSNGVGNAPGMNQNQNQNNNGFNGNQANTPNDAPIPGQGFQPAQDSPKPHAAPSDHPVPGMGQNQPEPEEPEEPQEQDQPAQAPQPAPQAPPQAPQPNEENQPEPEQPTPTAEPNEPTQPAPAPQIPTTAHPTQGATPNPTQTPNNTPNQDSNEQPPPHGGLAPVNPMQPGSDVAPMGFDHKKHGQDNGNAFCLGQCFPSKEAAKCGEPYSSPVYKPEHGCYTCCFAPESF